MKTKTSKLPPHVATLEANVQRAMPLARRIILTGISDLDHADNTDEAHLPAYLAELTGDEIPPHTEIESIEEKISQEEGILLHFQIEQDGAAAFALGIAMGLLLTPDVFGGKVWRWPMSASPKWIDSIHYELTKLKAINALVNAVAHAYSDEDVEPVDANEMFCNLAVVTDDVSERLTKIHDDATAMHDAWVRESKAGAKGDATGRAS